MTALHAQTLIEKARRAREERVTYKTSSSTRDLFCAMLVGYLQAYDPHVADELALALEMPELTEKALRAVGKEEQA